MLIKKFESKGSQGEDDTGVYFETKGRFALAVPQFEISSRTMAGTKGDPDRRSEIWASCDELNLLVRI